MTETNYYAPERITHTEHDNDLIRVGDLKKALSDVFQKQWAKSKLVRDKIIMTQTIAAGAAEGEREARAKLEITNDYKEVRDAVHLVGAVNKMLDGFYFEKKREEEVARMIQSTGVTLDSIYRDHGFMDFLDYEVVDVAEAREQENKIDAWNKDTYGDEPVSEFDEGFEELLGCQSCNERDTCEVFSISAFLDKKWPK